MTLVQLDTSLIGIGLYTPTEAQRLIGVPAGKLTRWLRGRSARGRAYDPLWASQVSLPDDQAYLGFRDLVQARVAAAFIAEGLSAGKVRQAIALAREILADEHPFASARFKSDGKMIALQVLQSGEDDRLIDLFDGQYVMRQVIEPSLRGIEFEESLAVRWWPEGRRGGIVLDPQRQFGQSIDDKTGVPTRVLARAVDAEGSVEAVSRAYAVSTSAVRHAVAFERRLAA